MIGPVAVFAHRWSCAAMAGAMLALAATTTPGCKSAAPPPPVVTPALPPDVPADRKLGWIVRLEQHRTLRDPSLPPRTASPSAASTPETRQT